jgi:ABC-type transporter Mla maintaining outer membrane lipid asymmetry ATPase subunit MlaF
VTERPIIIVRGVSRHTGESSPLLLQQLEIAAGAQLVLSGLDAAAAEVFVNLITGAALPDEGDVHVWGRDTREIATDTEWLSSLDPLGIVTRRAVLIEQLSIVSNLALPLTLAVDPVAPDVRERLERLARMAGLPAERLDAPAATLSGEERVRVHLARALAPEPALLVLEHPTEGLDARASTALGATLKQIGREMTLTWIALSNDAAFARATGAERRVVVRETGAVRGAGFWNRCRESMFGR